MKQKQFDYTQQQCQKIYHYEQQLFRLNKKSQQIKKYLANFDIKAKQIHNVSQLLVQNQKLNNLRQNIQNTIDLLRQKFPLQNSQNQRINDLQEVCNEIKYFQLQKSRIQRMANLNGFAEKQMSKIIKIHEQNLNSLQMKSSQLSQQLHKRQRGNIELDQQITLFLSQNLNLNPNCKQLIQNHQFQQFQFVLNQQINEYSKIIKQMKEQIARYKAVYSNVEREIYDYDSIANDLQFNEKLYTQNTEQYNHLKEYIKNAQDKKSEQISQIIASRTKDLNQISQKKVLQNLQASQYLLEQFGQQMFDQGQRIELQKQILQLKSEAQIILNNIYV